VTVLRAGGATHVGMVRQNNQDSLLMAPEAEVYGVADGMGGHQGGEVASAMAVELTRANVVARDLDALVAAAAVANRAIFERAGSQPELHGMGTTLVAVQLVDGPDGDEVGWINVGDSRVYLLRDDRLLQLSHDHSLVEDLVRDGQLTPDEAAVHPQRNIITRALGIDLDVNVDAGSVQPFTGDRFLVCSDGLFNEVSEDQIASVLRRLVDPDEAAAELIRLANEGGGRDNITVVLVDVVDDGGRSEAAAALLAARGEDGGLAAPPAEDLVTPMNDLPEVSVPVVRAPVEEEPYRDVFADRRSSLPEAADDYGADHDDLFGDVDRVRGKRVTWRVLGFVLLLLLVAAVVVGAIGWSARNTYFVTFAGDDVALYRGKPGGVLMFDPELVSRSKITRAEVPPALRPTIEAGKEFGSRSAAERYLVNLRIQATEDQPTTTTTTPATTTTTAAAGPTTTVPGATTTTAPAGP